MKITPTMKRETRNSWYASLVFHPKKWPAWSENPYHREGAAPLKKVKLPVGFIDMGEEEGYPEWLTDQVKFWETVAHEMQDGIYIAIID